jgi:hypothetical protein
VVTDINGLYPTKHRLALLRAIDYDRGRISYDPREGVVWDHTAGLRVTNRCQELIQHEWIRALTPDEPRGPGELSFRTYYRLTDYGRTALRGDQ